MLTADQRIIKERVKLLVHRPFFGHLALGLKLKEAPEVGTMATDGEHLLYNPTFVNRLDDKVLRTIVAHETLHCALGHLWRIEDRKPDKWNQAADYATNLILHKEQFVVPNNCLCDEKYEGMCAETIYNKLPDVPPKGKRLMDSHKPWKEKDGKKKKTGSATPNEVKTSEDKKNLAKIWEERLARAAAAARMQGKLPGTLDKYIQDTLQPQINWRIILRDMITSCARNNFSLIPPSKKHLWRGIYLPSLEGEQLEVAIAIDTSGSISETQFQEFAAEVRGIAEQFADYVLHIFFCDADVHDRFVLTPFETWPDKFPKRNGGTSFVPVFNALENDSNPVSAIVYLTDGYGIYPEYQPEYPVIWVLTQPYDVPWGQTISMEDCT